MTRMICEIKGATKRFPGVVALDDVSLTIEEGQIHAIVGENGAGKSTLMNILSGVYTLDKGALFLHGKEARFKEPRDAQHAGIAMIHQELSLSPYLSVAENIFQGRMPKTKLGLIDKERMTKDAAFYLDILGVNTINPSAFVETLSVSEMQLVEIAKAISLNAKILIMDEPTSSLTNNEVRLIVDVVRRLKAEGMAILYISHKMEEIMEISDKVTVLCDGKYVGTTATADTSIDKIIEMMVGREYQAVDSTFIDNYETRTPILEIENLCDTEGRVENVFFQLYKGEVLGLTGLIGAGRSELLETIFGVRRKKSGRVKLGGEEICINTPKQAIAAGIALIPEGRKINGLFLDMSVMDNMAITKLKALKNKIGLLSKRKILALCEEYKGILNVRTPSLQQDIVKLSGGNQQKVIIARWLMMNPKIIFMDEPTHGIDIGAKSEIYKIIRQLAAEGASIVLLSSEMPEVLSNCDRIMVMHNGKLRDTMNNRDASQVRIMELALEEKKGEIL